MKVPNQHYLNMTNIKKLVKVVMAFVLLLGLTVTFVGNASAETTYAGDGEYTVNVYHNETMTTQPMKGKVDNAFKSATVTKVGKDRYIDIMWYFTRKA